MSRFYTFVITLLLLTSAQSALAVNCNATPQTINDIFVCFAVGNMMGLIPVLILVGLVTFLSGVLKYVRAGDNEESRSAGRQVMIYGIIILFVMISFWGFVKILTQSFFARDPMIPNYLPPLQTQ